MLQTTFKKLLSCALILALLFSAALAENWFGGLFQNMGAPKLRFISVKEKAFSTETARVIASDGEGGSVLIANAFEIYLWNVSRNKRVPLRLTDERDIEQFNAALETAFVLRLAGGKDQLEARQKKFEEVRDSYCRQHGIDRFTSFDEVSECFPRLITLGANAKGIGRRYALIEMAQFGVQLRVDLKSGECGFLEAGNAAFCGDKLFDPDDGSITRLETGEVTSPAYALPESDSELSMGERKDLLLLSDDSVALLIPEAMTSGDHERNMHLRFASEKNGFDVVLGSFKAFTEPDTLVATGNGKYVAAFSRFSFRTVPSFILNCESGEVTRLEAGKLMMVSAAEDSFILYDTEEYGTNLIELNPETMRQSTLPISGTRDGGLAALSSLVTNGEGLYFVQGDILHGYFKLDK